MAENPSERDWARLLESATQLEAYLNSEMNKSTKTSREMTKEEILDQLLVQEVSFVKKQCAILRAMSLLDANVNSKKTKKPKKEKRKVSFEKTVEEDGGSKASKKKRSG